MDCLIGNFKKNILKKKDRPYHLTALITHISVMILPTYLGARLARHSHLKDEHVVIRKIVRDTMRLDKELSVRKQRFNLLAAQRPSFAHNLQEMKMKRIDSIKKLSNNNKNYNKSIDHLHRDEAHDKCHQCRH